MPTDAQIEAARAEFRRRWPEVSPSVGMMRACLEAAERAALAPHLLTKKGQKMPKVQKMPIRTWVIDWRIEGSVEVKAATAEDAQAIFDKRFGSPRFASPQNGEVSNDPPYLMESRDE